MSTLTIGRDVWFYPVDEPMNALPNKPLAAKITAIWGEHSVNVVVWDINGVPHGRTSVYFEHPGEGQAKHPHSYCRFPTILDEAVTQGQAQQAQQQRLTQPKPSANIASADQAEVYPRYKGDGLPD